MIIVARLGLISTSTSEVISVKLATKSSGDSATLSSIIGIWTCSDDIVEVNVSNVETISKSSEAT